MEDVLEVYTRPHDPKRPLVCMDETSKQLIGETRLPLPLQAGRPRSYDYEYTRKGVSNLFILFEPLAGRRQVKVTDQRTSRDWAELMRELVDEHYPHLNTHTTASLYEAFAPEEARRIAQRLELHHTPKHGSWLNMAEIALSILLWHYQPQMVRSCLTGDSRRDTRQTRVTQLCSIGVFRAPVR